MLDTILGIFFLILGAAVAVGFLIMVVFCGIVYVSLLWEKITGRKV